MVVYPIIYRVFLYPRWCRISSINSMISILCAPSVLDGVHGFWWAEKLHRIKVVGSSDSEASRIASNGKCLQDGTLSSLVLRNLQGVGKTDLCSWGRQLKKRQSKWRVYETYKNNSKVMHLVQENNLIMIVHPWVSWTGVANTSHCSDPWWGGRHLPVRARCQRTEGRTNGNVLTSAACASDHLKRAICACPGDIWATWRTTICQ